MTNFVDQDYWGVKIKIGRERLGEDVERLRGGAPGHWPVHATDGGRQPAVVGGRGHYPGAGSWRSSTCSGWRNRFLAEDHAGYERLSNTVNVALATGEGEWQPEGFLDLFQRGAIQFVQADVCRGGAA